MEEHKTSPHRNLRQGLDWVIYLRLCLYFWKPTFVSSSERRDGAEGSLGDRSLARSVRRVSVSPCESKLSSFTSQWAEFGVTSPSAGTRLKTGLPPRADWDASGGARPAARGQACLQAAVPAVCPCPCGPAAPRQRGRPRTPPSSVSPLRERGSRGRCSGCLPRLL